MDREEEPGGVVPHGFRGVGDRGFASAGFDRRAREVGAGEGRVRRFELFTEFVHGGKSETWDLCRLQEAPWENIHIDVVRG